MATKVLSTHRQVLNPHAVDVPARLEAAATQLYQKAHHTTLSLGVADPDWKTRLIYHFPNMNELLDLAFPGIDLGILSGIPADKLASKLIELAEAAYNAIAADSKTLIAHQDPGAFKTTIVTEAPPAEQIHHPTEAPYPSLEALLKAELGITSEHPTQAELKKMRPLAGCARNMDDLVYEVTPEEIPAGFQTALKNVPKIRIAFSHNSQLNGKSYYNEKGELVQISHAISASEHRTSPNIHLLRRVSNDETGETIAYTGRPETKAKAEEQAEFIFRSELAAPENTRKLIKNSDGSYTLNYVVTSFIDATCFFRIKLSEKQRKWLDLGEPLPGLHLENEKKELAALKGKTLTIDGHKVTLNPILVNIQWSSGYELEQALPPWLSGEWFSDEMTEAGIRDLIALAPQNSDDADLNFALEKLKTAGSGDGKLPPDERNFYLCVVCKKLKIARVIHCKSSKDRTGTAIAFDCATFTCLTAGMPATSLLGKHRQFFDRLFMGHLMAAHQVSNYGLGASGQMCGEQLEAGRIGLDIKEAPPTLKHVPDAYKSAHPFADLWAQNKPKAILAIVVGIFAFIGGLILEALTLVGLFGMGDALTAIRCVQNDEPYSPGIFIRKHWSSLAVVPMILRATHLGIYVANLFASKIKINENALCVSERSFSKKKNKIDDLKELIKVTETLFFKLFYSEAKKEAIFRAIAEQLPELIPEEIHEALGILGTLPQGRIERLQAGLGALTYNFSNYNSTYDQALLMKLRPLIPTFKAILNHPILKACFEDKRKNPYTERDITFIKAFVEKFEALPKTPAQELECLSEGEFQHLLQILRNAQPNATPLSLSRKEEKTLQVILNNLEELRSKASLTDREKAIVAALSQDSTISAVILHQINTMPPISRSRILQYLQHTHPAPSVLDSYERRLLLNIANYIDILRPQNEEQRTFLQICQQSEIALFKLPRELSREKLADFQSIDGRMLDWLHLNLDTGKETTKTVPVPYQNQIVPLEIRHELAKDILRQSTTYFYVRTAQGERMSIPCLSHPNTWAWDTSHPLYQPLADQLQAFLAKRQIPELFDPLVQALKQVSVGTLSIALEAENPEQELKDLQLEHLTAPLQAAIPNIGLSEEDNSLSEIEKNKKRLKIFAEELDQLMKRLNYMSIFSSLKMLPLSENLVQISPELQEFFCQTTKTGGTSGFQMALQNVRIDGTMLLPRLGERWDIELSKENPEQISGSFSTLIHLMVPPDKDPVITYRCRYTYRLEMNGSGSIRYEIHPSAKFIFKDHDLNFNSLELLEKTPQYLKNYNNKIWKETITRYQEVLKKPDLKEDQINLYKEKLSEYEQKLDLSEEADKLRQDIENLNDVDFNQLVQSLRQAKPQAPLSSAVQRLLYKFMDRQNNNKPDAFIRKLIGHWDPEHPTDRQSEIRVAFAHYLLLANGDSEDEEVLELDPALFK